jgi:trans-aconitate methyltransferase
MAMGNSRKDKKDKRPRRTRSRDQARTESIARTKVEYFLRRAGCRSRQIADEFWGDLLEAYEDDASKFLELAEQRRSLDSSTPEYAQLMEEQYALKNKSLDFSIEISSQYSSRFYAAFLMLVSRLSFEPAPATILDIGCDNGILTSFYAEHFPNAKVLGIDRCKEAVAAAESLKQRLGLTNLSFAHADAFAQPPANDLSLHKWDLLFMSLAGYEELDRHRDTQQHVAARIYNLLSPSGTAVVVDPMGSEVIKNLIAQGGPHELWTITFEDFGRRRASVDCLVVKAKPESSTPINA